MLTCNDVEKCSALETIAQPLFAIAVIDDGGISNGRIASRLSRVFRHSNSSETGLFDIVVYVVGCF